MEHYQSSQETKRRRADEGGGEVATKLDEDDEVKIRMKVEHNDEMNNHIKEEEDSEAKEDYQDYQDVKDEEADEDINKWEDEDDDISSDVEEDPQGQIGQAVFVRVNDEAHGQKTFAVSRHIIWKRSAPFRKILARRMINPVTSFCVITSHKTFSRFRTWLHEGGTDLYRDHNGPEGNIDLIKLYCFAFDYTIPQLRRDAMNCILQRFEDAKVPSEEELLYFIQKPKPLFERKNPCYYLDPLWCNDALWYKDPLWYFMLHMALYFMDELSFEAWEKLTKHDQTFAHMLYTQFRKRSEGPFLEGPVSTPQDLEWVIAKEAEHARTHVLAHWCHWHAVLCEQNCDRETEAQRKAWKVKEGKLKEEDVKEEESQ
ncbi:uncharacterized protein BDZ99DRAFT_561803 [Mytilinidion resinicola]|uniref:BTB domain-containing protein n=1 Tax=Mytilinidion resinicola TaxID=574789 RepID=A0A6A6YRL7_9PEZI|nr:uncharacterized protein BDZ99DRAFT_561803 [Mytilinidion resinicola]KAF2811013.1 hypothetical protein BDZ99DRAFT_561803 [Mytilinidion resinicola]